MKRSSFLAAFLILIFSFCITMPGAVIDAEAAKGGGGGKNKVPEATCVPWDGSDLSAPHTVIAGEATTLKAAASDQDGTVMSYQWDFGDGNIGPVVELAVPAAMVYTIEATHTYSGSPGTTYNATLTVVDDKGAEGTGTYPVSVMADNLATRNSIAIDKALWFMHKNLFRYDCAADPAIPCGTLDDGFWNPVGVTDAFALQGFNEQGHLPANAAKDDPYVNDARLLLNEISQYIQVMASETKGDGAAFPVLDPDSNSDGLFMYPMEDELEYEPGVFLKAIVTSNIGADSPDVADELYNHTGDPAKSITNFTWSQVAQNMVDYLAWSQLYMYINDYNSEPASKDITEAVRPMSRGGWPSWYEGWRDIETRSRGAWADIAQDFWAVLGLEAAEAAGLTVPQFVKDELALHVAADNNQQNLDPADVNYGSVYWGPNNPNLIDLYPTSQSYGENFVANYHLIERAAMLLPVLNYLGVSRGDERVEAALTFIKSHWNNHNYDIGQSHYGPYTTARSDSFRTWTWNIETERDSGSWNYDPIYVPGMNYSFFHPYVTDGESILWGWEEGYFTDDGLGNPVWNITKAGDDYNLFAFYALSRAMKGYGITDEVPGAGVDPDGYTWEERLQETLSHNQLTNGSFNEYNWVYESTFGTPWALMTMVEKAPVPPVGDTSVSVVTPFTWSSLISGNKTQTETLSITVRVVDAVGTGVEGAAVTADLSGPASEPGMTATTDASGNAEFQFSLRKQLLPPGTYTLSVTDVSASGTTWDQTPPVSDNWTK